jgi:putative PEP-CTERM system TPR-repeat lipoprotein
MNGPKAMLVAGFAAFLLAGTAAPSLAATAEQEKSDKFYREAQEYMKKRDVNSAVIQLKNALKADPGNIAARLMLADIYNRLNQAQYAEKELRAAEQRGAPFSDIMIELGKSYLMQGRFEDLMKEITVDKATDANRSDVLVLRGQAELGQKHYDVAESLFEEAHKAKPQDARSLVGISQSLVSRGRVEDAEKQVDEALKIQPDLLEAEVLKADLRRLNRDLESAITWFSKAIAQRPNHIPARLGRASAYIDLNRDAEADPDLKAVLASVPRYPIARYLQALILAKKKDYVGAKDMLLDAGAALDDHLPSMFLRGAVSYALGEYEQAQSQLTRYLAVIPQNARARKLLAATYVRSNQAQKAVETLKPLENAPDLDSQTLSLIGTAYMQTGDVSKGSEFFEKAAEASPEQAGIRTQLAVSRLVQGQTDKAEEDLEAAVNINKDQTQAGILLTLVRLRKGEFDDALTSAEQLTKAMPESPLPQNLLGAAWLGKGDTAKARQMFEGALKTKADFAPARMNLAQLDVRENKLSDAKEQYDAILKTDAKNVAAMMGMATVAGAEKNEEQAVTWLNRAADADPRNVQPRLRLIALYSDAGKPEQALTTARDLALAAPNNPQVIEVLGRAEIAADHKDRALEAFKRLTEVAPKATRSYTLLASAQSLSNDLAGARASLQKAIEIEKGNVAARVALIELEMRDKKPDAALKAADDLKKVDPKRAVGDMMRGDVLVNLKKFDDAVKAYDAASKIEDTPIIAIRRYTAQRAAGKTDVAYQTLEKWVAGNNNATARNVLASAYIADKKYPKAIEHTLKLLEADQNNAILLNNLAWAYQQTGDKRAKEYGEKALAAAPKSPAIMDTLGWILVQSDDPQRGFDLLKQAADAAPNQGDIRYHLAAAMQKQGKSDDARKELEKLLADNAGVVNFTLKSDAEKMLKELKGG